jgi:hypothetical protein
MSSPKLPDSSPQMIYWGVFSLLFALESDQKHTVGHDTSERFSTTQKNTQIRAINTGFKLYIYRLLTFFG